MRSKTDPFMELFLIVLRPIVYSGSSSLAKVALSLYGFVHSVSVVRQKRLGALKSLLNYGVAVAQKKLGFVG